jgi:hypothetical protein
LLKSVNLNAPASVIPVSDTFYIAMGAYDRMEGSNAFLSLAKYDLYIDDDRVYTYKKTGVPIAQGRYLNSFLQYDQRLELDRTLLKTWLEPGNLLYQLIDSPGNGLFSLPDTLEHQLKIVLTDDYGNSSVYRYKVARRASQKAPQQPIKGKAMLWAMDNYYETEGFQAYIPMGSLCKSIDFYVEQKEMPDTVSDRVFYAPFWYVDASCKALQKPMRLTIRADVPDTLKEKAVVVSVSEKGKCSSAGGRWRGDFIETNSYNYGNYSVAIDTIPPEITPRFNTTDFRGKNQISFGIKDDLSGIKSYEGYIDGAWALFVFDAKNGRLSYTFDKIRIGNGKTHTLELKVIDHCNNESTYTSSFTW